MDTKHKPRLNRQKKHFERGGGAFDLGGLLTAYGISSGGRLTGWPKPGGLLTGGRLTGGGDWPVAAKVCLVGVLTHEMSRNQNGVPPTTINVGFQKFLSFILSDVEKFTKYKTSLLFLKSEQKLGKISSEDCFGGINWKSEPLAAILLAEAYPIHIVNTALYLFYAQAQALTFYTVR